MKKILLLLLPLALISCSSDNDNETVTEQPVNAVTFIKGTLDGQPLEYTFIESESTQALYTYTSGYSGSGFTNYYYYAGMFLPYNDFNGPSVILGWNNMVVGNHSSETESFPTAFATVPTNFLTSSQDDSRMKGVEITYQTSRGGEVYYSTKDGSQAGSTFTVTSAASGTDALTGLKTQIITGTFSCKLYNQNDQTDVKTLTGGTYKVIVREFD